MKNDPLVRTLHARAALAMAAALALTTGCAEEVTGPKPTVESAGKDLPVAPGIACRAQLTTDIAVHGTHFSPIVTDIPDDARTALPNLTLVRSHELDGSAGDGAEVLYSGDPDTTTNLSLLSWQSQEQMTFTINQQVTLADGKKGEIPVGLYDVRVTNPNTNETEEPGAIAITDKPTLAAPAPGIVCLAEDDRAVTLTGTTFLEINGAQVQLEVDGVADPVAIDGFGDGSCTDIAHQGISAKYCTTANVTLTKDLVTVGRGEEAYPALTVHNPETAACTSEEPINLRVVPPPSIDAVVAPLACVAQADRTFDVQGADFLQIDGEYPQVTIAGKPFTVTDAGGCAALETMGHDVQKCSSLTVAVPMGELDPGTPEVLVQNPAPAGCSVSNTGVLVIVPPPTVLEVVPPLTCLDDGSRTVEVHGNDFLTVDGAVPAVTFDAVTVDAAAVAASNCTDIAVDGLTVQKCEILTVTLAQNELPTGTPEVTVENPQPAGCNDIQGGLLTVVPGPAVTAAAPPLVCTDDSARSIVLTGTGFLDVAGTLPTVTLDGNDVTVDGVSDCTDVTVNNTAVQSCTTLNITVPQGTLAEGDTVAVVTNPDPAGCDVSNDVVITVPPQITAVSAAPQAACINTGVQTVDITGTGFLRVDGTDPTVTAGGATVTPTAFTGCADLDVDGLGVQSCTGFSIDIDTGALPLGAVEISVANPDPSGCGLTDSTLFAITPPPSITAVAPDNVCADDALSLTITGTGFVDQTIILAGTTPATGITVNSDTELVATFDAGLPAGTYDLTVENGPGCTSTLAGGLIVDPTPIVFFVKPQVLYNGSTIEATIFTTGLKATASAIELVDASDTVTSITNFSSPDRPNRIIAEIPAGLPAGDYEVRVTSAIGCVGGLPGGVTITDTLTLDLDPTKPIDPSFVSPTTDTAVTILADTTGVGFENGATVYLDPVGGGTATELSAVVVDPNNAFQLTAVIPANLDPGTYDLIVVNPSGTVGLAADAVTVTVGEPPTITAVDPVSLSNQTNATMTLFGTSFDVAGVDVNLICSDPTTGVVSTLATTVTGASLTSTSVQVTAPTAGLAAGTVCVVQLINSTDGASYDYSAVSVKNPAQNLFPWASAGSDMLEGRRGLGLVAARPTSASRFLYAIGGDDGTLAGAKTSVEATPTDVFGNLGTWSLQVNSLPSPRTMAGFARIEDFIYLTGGDDGAAAQSTVLRAQVLDPLAGPDFIDLDAALGDGTAGLGGGLWLYRVSAIFPSTDPSNPSGESLAGEPLDVRLPDRAEGIILTLSWEEVAGASGYRIYRTPAVDGTIDQVELLTEITCGDQVCVCGVDIACSYDDDGQTATTGGSVPLPPGSLGTWHELTGSPLGGGTPLPRSGHATVAVENPGDPGNYLLYVFGGRDDTGTLLSSYEWASVTVDPVTGAQTVSGWTTGSKDIGAAKADLGAWVVTNSDTSNVPAGEVAIFVGTGNDGGGGGGLTSEVVVGTLSSGSASGDLISTDVSSLDAVTGTVQAVTATATGDGSGFLFYFGGDGNGALIATDSSNAVISGPDLANQNSLAGGSLLIRRAFAAAAQESAFFYVAGGRTLADPATTSVEQTVQ